LRTPYRLQSEQNVLNPLLALPEARNVQQKLMRHSDIRATMNIYGDAATSDTRNAHEKVVSIALRQVTRGT
jgi:integrase